MKDNELRKRIGDMAYPYLDLDEYKSFIEEKIRKVILDTNIMQG